MSDLVQWPAADLPKTPVRRSSRSGGSGAAACG